MSYSDYIKSVDNYIDKAASPEEHEVLKEIENLKTLDNIKKNSEKLKKIYKYYNNDFFIIYKCVALNFSIDVIEFFLEKFQLNSNDRNRYPLILLKLLRQNKLEEFELFLKYGFNINEEFQTENNTIENLIYFYVCNKVFYINNEKIKFLITHGGDVNYKGPSIYFNFFIRSSPLDIIISHTCTDLNKGEKSYELLKFIINYYSVVNNQTIIKMIQYGRKRIGVSEIDFTNIIQTELKFLEFGDLNDETYNIIVSREKDLKISKLILSYYGYKGFAQSAFYKKLVSGAQRLCYIDYAIKIENLWKKMEKEENDRKNAFHQLFDNIKRKKFKNVKNILESHPYLINFKNDQSKTLLMYAAQYGENDLKILNLLLKYSIRIFLIIFKFFVFFFFLDWDI